MKVSVVIPTHNRSDALTETLQKLSLQKFSEEWELFVVNNNCTDDTDEIVGQQNLPVKVNLIYEKTPGAAASRNAGARVARGKYLVFLDNDILVEPDFLERHLHALQMNPSCWIVGKVNNLPEQERTAFGTFRKSLAALDSSLEIKEISGFTGANSSMPRRDFEALGGFDKRFYDASSEDHELAMRARKQLGIKVLYFPSIVAVHNDWAGWTFSDFCLRQEIYARFEYLLWKKYGREHPRLKLVEENLPPNWSNDSSTLLFRKVVKRILAASVTQTSLKGSCSILEKFAPSRPFLHRLYKLAIAGAINKGFREGMQTYEKE
ncbi:MAG: glycosyltransferase family 2 protein [Pyrinomonadaceae bacterium]|nr:glycosyltransferase family 2 protein [Pyrinomonadaceae bacterium]